MLTLLLILLTWCGLAGIAAVVYALWAGRFGSIFAERTIDGRTAPERQGTVTKPWCDPDRRA